MEMHEETLLGCAEKLLIIMLSEGLAGSDYPHLVLESNNTVYKVHDSVVQVSVRD